MKFRTITAAAASLALAGTLAVGSTAAAQEAPSFGEILAAQGDGPDRNWYDYDILAAGVAVTGLGEPLDAAENITVFLPNDRAFQALAADLFGWRMWFASEAQVLDKIASLGVDTLTTVITYHVVTDGAIDSATALGVPRGTALNTLQGEQIKVYPIKRFGTAVLADRDRNDLNPFLVKSQLDIRASGGIGHGIALVLRPVDL